MPKPSANKKPRGGAQKPAVSAELPSTPIRQGRARRWLDRLQAASRDRGYRLAIAGGLMGALAWEPVNLKLLMLPALLCAFFALTLAPTAGAAARRMLVFGWLIYFGGLHWLCTLYVFNPVAPLGILLLAGYVAAWPAAGAWLHRRWLWTGRPALDFATFSAWWVLLEWLRTLGRLAMPLAQINATVATWPWAIQIAAWGGEVAVSAQLLWATFVLLMLWRLCRAPAAERRRAGIAALAAGAPLVALVAMLAMPTLGPAPAPENPIRVALLQPNIDQMTKFASYAHEDPGTRAELQEAIARINELLVANARLKGQRWDILIMPETSFTELDFFTNEPLRERVSRLARDADSEMLIGAARWLINADEVYNSAYLLSRDGAYESIYDKRRLVPFGESLPYFEHIPGMQSVVGIGSFNEGESYGLFVAERATFGLMICFESTFGQLARALTVRGAQYLAVITNDAWYGKSAGAATHHHASLLRAVETGRWVVRAANTGISAIVSPLGRETARLPLGEQGVLVGEIEAVDADDRTLYMRLGPAWLALPAGWLVAVLFVSRRNRRSPSIR